MYQTINLVEGIKIMKERGLEKVLLGEFLHEGEKGIFGGVIEKENFGYVYKIINGYENYKNHVKIRVEDFEEEDYFYTDEEKEFYDVYKTNKIKLEKEGYLVFEIFNKNDLFFEQLSYKVDFQNEGNRYIFILEKK